MTKTKTITTATTKDGTRVTTNPEAEFEVSRGLSSYRLLIMFSCSCRTRVAIATGERDLRHDGLAGGHDEGP